MSEANKKVLWTGEMKDQNETSEKVLWTVIDYEEATHQFMSLGMLSRVMSKLLRDSPNGDVSEKDVGAAIRALSEA